MRAILFDQKEMITKEVEIDTKNGLEDYYKYLDCQTFDISVTNVKGHEISMFVDDEGLEISGNVVVAEVEKVEAYIFGSILFLGGADKNGNTLALPDEITVEDIMCRFIPYGTIK